MNRKRKKQRIKTDLESLREVLNFRLLEEFLNFAGMEDSVLWVNRISVEILV